MLARRSWKLAVALPLGGVAAGEKVGSGRNHSGVLRVLVSIRVPDATVFH